MDMCLSSQKLDESSVKAFWDGSQGVYEPIVGIRIINKALFRRDGGSIGRALKAPSKVEQALREVSSALPKGTMLYVFDVAYKPMSTYDRKDLLDNMCSIFPVAPVSALESLIVRFFGSDVGAYNRIPPKETNTVGVSIVGPNFQFGDNLLSLFENMENDEKVVTESRKVLRDLMTQYGFVPDYKCWWRFSFENLI